jgi:hypothetical protein
MGESQASLGFMGQLGFLFFMGKSQASLGFRV